MDINTLKEEWNCPLACASSTDLVEANLVFVWCFDRLIGLIIHSFYILLLNILLDIN